jgi:hypothetical protein
VNNIIQRLKREIFGAIPTVVFFFIVFQLLALTRALILKTYDIQVSTFLNATIAALIVGKVVLFADLLPFMNRFPNKPLFYNIAWKTFIYMIAAFAVSYVEHFIPLICEYKNLTLANSHLFDQIVWPHFWLIQLWMLVCFFMYNTIREIGRIFGRKKLQSMFFGPGNLDGV